MSQESTRALLTSSSLAKEPYFLEMPISGASPVLQCPFWTHCLEIPLSPSPPPL